MTPEGRRRLLVALAAMLTITFAVLAHAAVVEGVPPMVGAMLSLIPAAVLLLWIVRRTRHRIIAAVAIAAIALGLWLGWAQLERHFPSLFFLEQAGANLALGILFGRTLLAGREPLVTRFARVLHDELPPEVERYTRQVTFAWAIFFATLFTASCVLYLANYIAAWSFFANILSPILIGAMFVVEYAIRHRVLPNWHRVGILGSIRACSRHFQTSRRQAT